MQLVVARYLESLNWLRRVPPQFERVVYDKSPNGNLSNVGREAHTYLHHIIQNYDALPELLIFCQGHPFDHAFDFHATLRSLSENPHQVADFRWIGHIIDTDTSDGALFRSWSKNEDGRSLDLAGFHRALFGVEGPEEYVFTLGAQFAATRELIHSRPREFYQKALQISVNFPDAAHCFERTWDKVFGVEGVNRQWLAGRKTVYLKSIKRLEDTTVDATS